MTETEWLASSDPYSMLDALKSTPFWDEGKVRLFACWCARQVWHLLLDARSRQAVEVAELFAACPVDSGELTAAEAAAEAAVIEATEETEEWTWEATAAWSAAQAAAAAATTVASGWAAGAAAETPAGFAAREAAAAAAAAAAAIAANETAGAAAEQAQAETLREMFGNPFRPSLVTF